MIQALQRLPSAEEKMWIDIACSRGLERSTLGCVMTRQHGEGSYISKSRGILAGRECDISYDLMLCEFCGRLIPELICPGKVLKIKEKLLSE